MTRLNVTIKESDNEIQNRINKVIAKRLNLSFPNSVREIESLVKKRLFDAIVSQPEYKSLDGGTLGIELGLVDGVDRLRNIIIVWLNNIEVKFTKFSSKGGKSLTGGITINAIDNTYDDVLSLGEANFVTEKGENLPWLAWLLSAGSSTIIADYRIRFAIGSGRTGGGSMKTGGSWQVPPQFAGRNGDNFITRAILGIQDDLEQDVKRIVESKI